MAPLRYLSVCAGIEAATVAWHPLGWAAVAFSEINPFACAVLAHHYPDVPNWGDMTQFQEWPDAVVDVLVGGTPCQSFSVAGLRAGLADPRGNLMLTYLAVADRYRPEWLVWENVPGVLSSDKGRAFGSFLGGLAELGYGWAYRVLDAQYFGLAQRRKRMFVVGCLGGWQCAAAVLFDEASLRGDPAPRREARQVAPTIPARRSAGGGLGTDFDYDGGLVAAPHADISPAIKARDSKGPSSDGDGDGAILIPMVAHALRGDGFDASEDGTGRGTPLVAFGAKDSGADAGDIAPTLRAGGHTTSHANGGCMPAVAFQSKASASQSMNPGEVTPGLDVGKSDGAALMLGAKVRRITPREAERLQGFPDEFTLVPYRGKPAADENRYKALGNSMAVPVMARIGQRIQQLEGAKAHWLRVKA